MSIFFRVLLYEAGEPAVPYSLAASFLSPPGCVRRRPALCPGRPLQWMTSFWLTHSMASAGTGWELAEGREREVGVFLPPASGLSVCHWPFLPGSPTPICRSNTINWGGLCPACLLQLSGVVTTPRSCRPLDAPLHACFLHPAHTWREPLY